MSMELFDWAFRLKGLGFSEKILLMRLCDRAEPETRSVQVSQRELAEECEMCEDTLRVQLASLRDRGYLRSEGVEGGWLARRRYTICPPETVLPARQPA